MCVVRDFEETILLGHNVQYKMNKESSDMETKMKSLLVFQTFLNQNLTVNFLNR